MDEHRRTGLLTQGVPDVTRNGEVSNVHIGRDPRPEWAEGVKALSPSPLAISLLQVARRDVVGAGVAEDHLVDALLRHLAAHPPDNDREFCLMLNLL